MEFPERLIESYPKSGRRRGGIESPRIAYGREHNPRHCRVSGRHQRGPAFRRTAARAVHGAARLRRRAGRRHIVFSCRPSAARTRARHRRAARRFADQRAGISDRLSAAAAVPRGADDRSARDRAGCRADPDAGDPRRLRGGGGDRVRSVPCRRAADRRPAARGDRRDDRSGGGHRDLSRAWRAAAPDPSSRRRKPAQRRRRDRAVRHSRRDAGGRRAIERLGRRCCEFVDDLCRRPRARRGRGAAVRRRAALARQFAHRRGDAVGGAALHRLHRRRARVRRVRRRRGRQRRVDRRGDRAGSRPARKLAVYRAGLGAARFLGQLADLHHGRRAGAAAARHGRAAPCLAAADRGGRGAAVARRRAVRHPAAAQRAAAQPEGRRRLQAGDHVGRAARRDHAGPGPGADRAPAHRSRRSSSLSRCWRPASCCSRCWSTG